MTDSREMIKKRLSLKKESIEEVEKAEGPGRAEEERAEAQLAGETALSANRCKEAGGWEIWDQETENYLSKEGEYGQR